MRAAPSLLGIALLLLAGCGQDAPAAAKEGASEGTGVHAPLPETAPATRPFNEYVLALIDTYPADGTHGYHWPREGAWLGVTRNLVYGESLFAEGDPQGRCHCSGLTFEVFFRAWMQRCRDASRPERIRELDLGGLRRLQQAWFGVSGDRRTLRTALLDFGLGREITNLEDARPGDFVQLWRHGGSGHSCVFLAWLRDDEGGIDGLRYWSTQGSTNGIGLREEHFGEGGSLLVRDEFWLCRVGGP